MATLYRNMNATGRLTKERCYTVIWLYTEFQVKNTDFKKKYNKFIIVDRWAVEYLIVKPMPQQVCDMRVSYSRKWKRSRRPLDVGHRGLGSTYNLRE